MYAERTKMVDPTETTVIYSCLLSASHISLLFGQTIKIIITITMREERMLQLLFFYPNFFIQILRNLLSFSSAEIDHG